MPFSTGLRACIGQSLAHVMHDATVARLFPHFSFCLAARMGGPAGVDAKARLPFFLEYGDVHVDILWAYCMQVH